MGRRRCCCAEPCIDTEPLCGPCGALPASWLVTVSDFEDDICHDCNRYNGAFVLTEIAACVWRYDFDEDAVNGYCPVSYYQLSLAAGRLTLILMVQDPVSGAWAVMRSWTHDFPAYECEVGWYDCRLINTDLTLRGVGTSYCLHNPTPAHGTAM